ncbi:MAG: DUF6282 family protein [Desulfovibrio sp.]|nr:DUF6282 family protein [Desulfovibrio sp.]
MSEADDSRRSFMKGAALAAGAMLAGQMLDAPEAGAATAPIDPLLHGISDLHVHADPDVRPRSTDEIALARKAQQMGYRALMLKSHDWSTHDRAYLVREAVPGLECFGGLAMNRTHGDSVNVTAAKMTLKTTGRYCRCIWMPTYQSAWDASQHGGKGIPVVDGSGKLLPEVIEVMELCGKENIIFATGHSAPAESVLMSKKAKEMGVPKFVVTHASEDIWKLTMDQAKECLANGAYLEHAYLAAIFGPGTALPKYTRTPLEEIAAMIKLSPERSFITSDLGQAMMPSPVDGMRSFITGLLALGFPQKEIDLIARTNPAKLMGLDV